MADLIIRQTALDKPLNITDLTTKAFDGTGVLDSMLDVMRKHLDREFCAGRITGKEYADVYLGSYQHTLSSSIDFLIRKEMQSYEIEEILARIDLARKDLELKDYELKQFYPLQKEKLKAEVEIAWLQARIAEQELEIRKEELKIRRIEVEIKREELAIAREQLIYTRQKTITERAQTDASVIGPGSVIGLQNDAIRAQIRAYDFDARYKAAKLMVDTWITRRNTDDEEPASPDTGLHNANLRTVVEHMILHLP